jgi:hypothetical protein
MHIYMFERPTHVLGAPVHSCMHPHNPMYVHMRRCAEAVEALREYDMASAPSVVAIPLDLASLKSVREFVRLFKQVCVWLFVATPASCLASYS